jgi:hypothetical protein
MGKADDAEGRKMRLHRNDQLFLDFAPMDREEIERLDVMDKVLKCQRRREIRRNQPV